GNPVNYRVRTSVGRTFRRWKGNAILRSDQSFRSRAGDRIRTGDVQLGKPNRPPRKPLKTSHFQRTKPRFARRFVLRRAPPLRRRASTPLPPPCWDCRTATAPGSPRCFGKARGSRAKGKTDDHACGDGWPAAASNVVETARSVETTAWTPQNANNSMEGRRRDVSLTCGASAGSVSAAHALPELPMSPAEFC